MTIRITYEEVLFDVRSRSYHELANMPDVEQRYRCEAGSEKDELIKRCALEAVARVRTACSRWITDINEEYAENTGETPYDWTIEFSGGPRRLRGKAQDAASIIHAIIVNLTLCQFYLAVSQFDLSDRHDKHAKELYLELGGLIGRKTAPLPVNYAKHLTEER